MSKVLPILFNTDMVRAILDGRKTVTRRVIKPQPEPEQIYKIGYCTDGDRSDIGKFGFGTHECGGKILYVKPPCNHGDILYVREAFCPNYFDEGLAGYRGDGLRGNRTAYKADYHKETIGDVVPEPKWKSSIRMPKEVARIWLKVTDIRVERLQDITGDGVLSEGVHNGKSNPTMKSRWENMQKMAFTDLWNSTIKKIAIDRYGWKANPWVWVIEFERCEKPAPCILAGMHPAEIQEGQYEDGCTPKQNCMGYGDAWTDEPCEMCKNCQKCTGNKDLGG